MFQTSFSPLNRQNSSISAPEVEGRQYCEIILKPSLDPNHIRGKLVIRPGHLRGLGSLDYYGISVELQAELTINKEGGNLKRTLLSPHPHTSTVYKSRVFTLASGDEEGMQKCRPNFSPTRKLDPTVTFIPFELPLPADSSLPASLTTPNGTISYSLVAYGRSDKYKELERRGFNFYGHHPIHPQDEFVQIRQEQTAQGLKVTLTSPKKFVWTTDKVSFAVTLQFENGNEATPPVSLSLRLLRKIRLGQNEIEKVEDEVMDATTFKNVQFRGKEAEVSGKLKLGEQRKKLLLGRRAAIPTFNEESEPGIKIQYFLECLINAAGECPLELGISEEIIVSTGAFCLEEREQVPIGNSILSRFRSSSIGSSILSHLPPSYSRVMSRRGSLLSIQTLPPHYDDVEPKKKLST